MTELCYYTKHQNTAVQSQKAVTLTAFFANIIFQDLGALGSYARTQGCGTWQLQNLERGGVGTC